MWAVYDLVAQWAKFSADQSKVGRFTYSKMSKINKFFHMFVCMFDGVQRACFGWSSSLCLNCTNQLCLNCTNQLPDWMVEVFYAKEKLIHLSIFGVNDIPFALAVKRRVSHRHSEGQYCICDVSVAFNHLHFKHMN